MFKETMIQIIKIGSVTYIFYKSFKIVGRIEFGNIIGLTGIALCGINVVQVIKYWIVHPPMIINLLSKLIGLVEKIVC